MTKNEARAYFKEKKLSYNMIRHEDILMLHKILKEHLKHDVENNITQQPLDISEKIDSTYNSNGSLISCYLYMNGEYFRERECIFFNSDGFVGFCGWASDMNSTPIVSAFIEWCDFLYDLNKVEEYLIAKSSCTERGLV